jgi:hypothetical protein
MAKFKRGGFRRFARRSARFGRKAYKFGRKKGIFGGGDALIQLDAMAYGAIRPSIVALIGKVAPNIAGELDDELKMAIVDWAAGKYVGGALRSIAHKGLVVENARVGEYIGAPLIGGVVGTSGGGTSGSSSYLYG